MTATEITWSLDDAKLKEFGSGDQPAAVYPARYFEYGVTCTVNGVLQNRNPVDCATTEGATMIASLFTPDAILLGPALAWKPFGGPVIENKLVPWLQFGRKHVNAGQLLDCFNHGYPPAVAQANAQAQIDQEVPEV